MLISTVQDDVVFGEIGHQAFEYFVADVSMGQGED
jgi:hypothetical protein